MCGCQFSLSESHTIGYVTDGDIFKLGSIFKKDRDDVKRREV
jgi:hypothetical protein